MATRALRQIPREPEGLWGLAVTGFPYAIALKTGNPAAVNTSFLLFFPFAFLTTSFLPQEALTGWLSTVATYNPVTYVLAALRSRLTGGWQATPRLQGLLAILAVAAVSHTLAFLALRAGLAPLRVATPARFSPGTAVPRPSPSAASAPAPPVVRRAGSSPWPAGCPTRGSR